MQETQVWSLIWEDTTFQEATKPMHHSYGACALEPKNHNYWTLVPQVLKTSHPSACAQQQEKPRQWKVCVLQLESNPSSLWLEKSLHSNEDQAQQKKKINKIFKK